MRVSPVPTWHGLSGDRILHLTPEALSGNIRPENQNGRWTSEMNRRTTIHAARMVVHSEDAHLELSGHYLRSIVAVNDVWPVGSDQLDVSVSETPSEGTSCRSFEEPISPAGHGTGDTSAWTRGRGKKQGESYHSFSPFLFLFLLRRSRRRRRECRTTSSFSPRPRESASRSNSLP